MNREIKIILDILQEKRIVLDKDLDWYYILGFLELNKISGYFYNKTKEMEINLPRGIMNKLAAILEVQTERNIYMRRYIQKISDELRNTKIHYAFLKGSVLSNTNFQFSERTFNCMKLSDRDMRIYKEQSQVPFYKEGERISNDIDILIEQKDITVLADLLKDIGFVQGYYNLQEERIVPISRAEIISRRMNRGETAPFVLKTGNKIVPCIEIDINFSLDYLPNSYSNMLHTILGDTIDYSGYIKNGITGLNVDDFFLHLIMHQYKESILYTMVQRNKDVELYKLLDIFLFIKKGYIDLSGLYCKVKKYGLENPIWFVMNTVSLLFTDFNFSDYYQIFKPDCEKEFVLDPPSRKKYFWNKSVVERLSVYNKEQFLEEVQNE